MRGVTLRFVGFISLTFVLLSGALVAQKAAASNQYLLSVPLGIPAELWSYFIPKDNSLTPAKIELGRHLFFDKRLSADASVSCATCHDPKLAFTDGRKTAAGIHGRLGTRNSPSVLNAMFNSTIFWDGRADSLEEQAKQPLINADEMGNTTHTEVLQRIGADPEYANQFQVVFGAPISLDGLAKAIAAYERTLVSGNAPVDRFLNGDRNALSDAAQRGFNLFRGRARCTVCHSVNQAFPFFTDGNYRNTGVAANFGGYEELVRLATAAAAKGAAREFTVRASQRDQAELGRFAVSGDALDIGAFRTPSLRNVELTAPYFHDGSAATLPDVVRYYSKGGNHGANQDWELQTLNLSETEQRDLVEFLKSLTSDEAKSAGPK